MPDRYDPNPKIFREPIRRPASPCTFYTNDQPVYPAGTAIARYHTPSSKAGTYDRNEEAAAPTFSGTGRQSATPSTTRFAHAHTYSRQAAEELARRSLSDFARTMIPALDLTPFHRSCYRHARPVRPGRNPPADRVDSAPTRKIARFVRSCCPPTCSAGSPTAGSRWLPTTCVWPHGSTGRFSGSWTHPLTGAFSPNPPQTLFRQGSRHSAHGRGVRTGRTPEAGC